MSSLLHTLFFWLYVAIVCILSIALLDLMAIVIFYLPVLMIEKIKSLVSLRNKT